MSYSRPNMKLLNAHLKKSINLGQDADGQPQYRAVTAAERAYGRELEARIARANAEIARTGKSSDPYFQPPKKAGWRGLVKTAIFLGAGGIIAPTLAAASGIKIGTAKAITGLALGAAKKTPTRATPTAARAPQLPAPARAATPTAARAPQLYTREQLRLALALLTYRY